jgi:ribosomal protein S18 acetylase RimI-like enzyme
MHTINTTHDAAQMRELFRLAASWINNPAEFIYWTDRDFEFGKPIEDFLDNGRPQEVVSLSQNGQMVAYAELHRNSFGWVIARVLVHPSCRGQGLARLVMKACADRVFEKYFVVSLFCVLDNIAALSLYKSLGYASLEKYPDQNMQRMSLINPILKSASQVAPEVSTSK